MARIRTIKPDFFGDEKLSKLKRDVRLLYIGLWVFSDDYGTVRSNPVWIKSNIFPYDEELRVNDVKLWLDALVKARMLEPFEYNGEGFYNIRTFDAHQKVEKKSKPIVPLSEKDKILKQSGSSRGVVGEESVPEVVHSNSTEEIGSSKGNEPDGSAEAVASTPALQAVYVKMDKGKKSLCDFIKKQKPQFIEPYVALWNLFASEKNLAQVSKISDQRKKKFKVRAAEKSFDFLEILKKAGQSEFVLTGKWFGFDWILESESNYLKMIEGNYDKGKIEKNKTAPAAPAKKSVNEQADTDISYLLEKYSEGTLNPNLINPDYYDRLVIKGDIPSGQLHLCPGSTIEEQKRNGVINYFESLKTLKHAG